LLGMDITQDSYPGALFFSAGGYHHHVGINIWAGRGIPQPPPGAVGLVAFSLELPDKGSWQQAVDRVRGSGAELAALASPETGEFGLVKDPNGISVALTSRVPQTVDTREKQGRLNG
ncbi:MAG TPA: hypothetical protein VF813_09205, partial [Anaerolineaceae bacterium]